MLFRQVAISLLCITIFAPLTAQQEAGPVARKVLEQKTQHAPMVAFDLFSALQADNVWQDQVADEVDKASFFTISSDVKSKIQKTAPQLLNLSLVSAEGQSLQLELYKADFLTESFNIRLASGKEFEGDFGLHYWGIVNGDPNSLAAISIVENEVMGFVSIGRKNFTLGKLNNDDIHILYETKDILFNNPVSCDTDTELHYKGKKQDQAESSQNTDNCVQMYIEVDNDIVVGKGSVTAATDYVLGAFSQVSILYANESIDFTVNELLAWDTNDPYTGPSTSNYLDQFRNNLNGNYNGDLAHLVGYEGSGGIAYVDVLCNSTYGVGYSDINSTYSNVPTYSWTVEVLTHEIGHNLGSRHTHDCVWNGNGTAIDGCGYQAGYGGCDGPIPASGTIMSYCHLLSGVGIDFNLGFGPQPGDLIRSNVYNATCLISCAVPVADDAGISSIASPTGTICASSATPEVTLENFGSNTLTSVTIEYNIDNGINNTYNWTGSLASGTTTQVTLPSVTFTEGNHTFNASTSNPNGVSDEDASNDGSSSSFNRQSTQTYYADADGDGYGDPNNSVIDCTAPNGYVSNADDCNDSNANIYPGAACNDNDACTINDTYDVNCNCSGTYADSDGDGVCDAEDVCPGGDDNIDSDGDGTPDACDCNAATAQFPNDPLTHSGNGSSSTTYTFASGDSDVSFSISGLDAKINGNPNGRYIEEVTVTYVDGNGNSQTYGTYSGDNTSSASISITGEVQSVTLTLTDGYDGNTNQNMSVDPGQINYCGSGTPPCSDADSDGVCDENDICPGFDDNLIGTSCDDGDACTVNDTWTSNCACEGTYSDSDGDGVCDANDICEGGDDNLDSDGDGIPDFCDPSNCSNSITSNFSPDPLTHSGSGSSASTVSFPSGNVDVDFTINGLGAKTNGNPNGRYIEQVTVTYVDGSGNTITYGTYSGDQVSSVSVSISGALQSVELSLTDGYDGNTNQNMSIDPSDVTSCTTSGAFVNPDEDIEVLSLSVFPNPAQDVFTISMNREIEKGEVHIIDFMGRTVATYAIDNQSMLRISAFDWNSNAQLYTIRVYDGNSDPLIKKLVLVN